MKRLLLVVALVFASAMIAGVASHTATAAGGDGPGSYLCWNTQMVDPVAYPDAVADAMWATGKYTEPQAILGNVVGGVNLGAYHLVCNGQTLPLPSIDPLAPPTAGLDNGGQRIVFEHGQWWYPTGEPATPALAMRTMIALGVGGSGEVYDAKTMAAYHVDHPANGNDLNVYHIWK